MAPGAGQVLEAGPLPETLVRLLRHMEKSPDTARLRPGRLLPWAERHVPAPDPSMQGVHLANRFGDLHGRCLPTRRGR